MVTPAAIRSQSPGSHPNSWTNGARNSEASATLPVTTMSAPRSRRGHDGLHAEVRRGEHGIGGQAELLGVGTQVVPHHRGHPHPVVAPGPQRLDDRPPCGDGVDAPGVGDEPGPALGHVRGDHRRVQREVAVHPRSSWARSLARMASVSSANASQTR